MNSLHSKHPKHSSEDEPITPLLFMVWAIALAGFLVSASFNLFLFQRNHDLRNLRLEQNRVMSNLDKIQLGLRPMLQDLLYANPTNTELFAVLAKYGIQILPPINGLAPSPPTFSMPPPS